MLIGFAAAILFINIHSVWSIVSNRTNDFVDFMLAYPHGTDAQYHSYSNKCTNRLHTSLEKLRRRQANLKSTAYIDLSGYALHQSLRHLPLDMYVTDIRVRTPGVGDWVRIQKCQFSNRENRMTAQILFNDLTVSGNVQLLDDAEIMKNSFHPVSRDFCKMSLRLQRAGLGINAFPTRGRSKGIEVRTEARFMDPKFLSVHAYGCKLDDILKRSEKPPGFESFPNEPNNQFPINENNKHIESELQDRLSYPSNHTDDDYPSVRHHLTSSQELTEQSQDPEVRIITLNPGIRTTDDSSTWFNLHKEHETNLNDFHRKRILGTRLHTITERDRLKAVLHVQNLIAQQANHVFQTQGPFSQNQKPFFEPAQQSFPKPIKNHHHHHNHQVVSTITELDENLAPIRPVVQRPFEALFAQSEQIVNQPNYQNYYEEVSKEMEDVFLRGIKTLLTRYVEKQLEIPLKEALMVSFGYTVSYG